MQIDPKILEQNWSNVPEKDLARKMCCCLMFSFLQKIETETYLKTAADFLLTSGAYKLDLSWFLRHDQKEESNLTWLVTLSVVKQ